MHFGRVRYRRLLYSFCGQRDHQHVYDINDHLIAETDTNGSTQREYIWLNDIPVAVVDQVASGSPVLYFVHTDHLGRPARMTAGNTSWVWDVIYSPFGAVSYIWTNPEVMNASSSIQQCLIEQDNECQLVVGLPITVDGEFLTNCHYSCLRGNKTSSFVHTYFGAKNCPSVAVP